MLVVDLILGRFNKTSFSNSSFFVFRVLIKEKRKRSYELAWLWNPQNFKMQKYPVMIKKRNFASRSGCDLWNCKYCIHQTWMKWRHYFHPICTAIHHQCPWKKNHHVMSMNSMVHVDKKLIQIWIVRESNWIKVTGLPVY